MSHPKSPDPGWMGDPVRGASFGRVNHSVGGATPADAPRFTLQRVRLDAGGYDQGGAYWSVGEPLYWFCCGDIADGYVRGDDRNGAKAAVRRLHPNAQFLR